MSDDQPVRDLHTASVVLIAEIRETHRQREDLHRAEKRLTLQIKAICRRLCDGDKLQGQRLYAAVVKDGEYERHKIAIAASAALPLFISRDVIHTERMKPEKRLAKLAQRLPVWSWVEPIRGFGALGLAQIVGETGNLSNYANPGKLWKRMGVAVIEGARQRRVAGAAALEHGYSPRRRAVLFCIGDSIVRTGGPYRKVYDEMKELELRQAAEAGLTVLPAAKIPKGDSDHYRSEGHVHNRARRKMEKRLLLDLWREWRRTREPV